MALDVVTSAGRDSYVLIHCVQTNVKYLWNMFANLALPVTSLGDLQSRQQLRLHGSMHLQMHGAQDYKPLRSRVLWVLR